ncbi:sugar ABC transporter permease [Paenibacillus agaridevorans]|jgi:putative aldouronate transport system permease protein|uniref:Sugar ABC transporter permease n=1 Tax=Paenibacillus agaridevorans TaxID=171404 RepID=A0A2R5EZL7_9BACL|nr:ABC transporter permease subunit [Paenibacillus agaridevorans]GBG09263.1 sugar ABC transporter permease [Paenibacillus agaridevorans]
MKTKMPVMRKLSKDLVRNKYVYMMLLPVVAYYFIFSYLPMYGLQIAFKDFVPTKGIWHSDWAGFKHFVAFYDSYYFWRILRNTLLLSFYELVFGFPAPIVLALLLNELRRKMFKNVVQSITYLPHFISVVVVAGMMVDFLASDGIINQIVAWFGGTPLSYLLQPEWFRTIYVSSGIWQGVGWGSIIYLAAIAGIDPSLYEAARVDGAGRFRQLLNITLPGIMPTIMILLLLRFGHLMSGGSFEKILLLYKPTTYETADVISTFVYRRGLLQFDYGFSAAIGLMNNIVNFALLLTANALSRRFSEHKLW